MWKRYKQYIFIFLVGTVIVGFLAFSPQKHLHIVFLDVGQGDAVLIQTPLGKNILVDTGPTNNLDQKIAPYIKAGDRTIDMIILTHPDLDHIGGTVNILQRYDVRLLGHSGLLAGSQIYDTIAHLVRQKEIPTIALQTGQVIHIEPGLSFFVLAPSLGLQSFDANEYSVVMKLLYYDSSVMLTGDATKTTEYEISEVFQESMQSEILKVGHHGSQTSTSINFLEKVQPRYGIISAGCNNRFGHPHPDVLSNLFRFGVTVLDTCSQGDIVFESNGAEWVRQ